MYDVHWWTLEEMIRNGSAKNCYLRYNSNLSRVQFGNKNLYNYLPAFKDWLMCASIDGTGKIGEYIRTGLKWDEWLENFEAGLALPNGHNRMRIDLTITGPGMFSLKELFDLSLELNVAIETKVMFAFHSDIMFTAMAWPRDILNEVIDELLEYMRSRATRNQQTLIVTLESMRTRATHAEAYPDTYVQGAKNGKGWLRKIEEVRNDSYTIEDIYAANPKLLSWWKSI
jgi:hypothetical protein